MSNTQGQVIHGGKIVGRFEYYGTTHRAPTAFFDTYEEVCKHWRTWPEAKCTCGQPPVPVMLYTEYGGGHYWPSEACLTCHAITGDRSGIWDCYSDEWPKDGHPLGDEYQTEWARLCNMPEN